MTPPTGPRKNVLLAGVAVAALTLLCFLPALKGEFLNWDDEPYIVDEYRYRGLGSEELRWMSTTLLGGPYQPLTWLSFAFDHRAWGMDPWGFHLTNLLLHALNSLLFYLFCLRLFMVSSPKPPPNGREPPLHWPAAFSALLFSLHPLRVESVAWVIERKDVLSGAFFLAALNAYPGLQPPVGAAAPRRFLAALAPVLYACSLLSKAMAVTLPVLLLLLDIHPLRRLDPDPRSWVGPGPRGILREKAPYLLLALAAGWVNFLGQSRHASMPSLGQVGVLERLLSALYSLGFYAGKTLLPTALSPLYPRPETAQWIEPRFLLTAAGGFLLLALIFRLRKRLPSLAAAAASYAIILAPVSGLVPFGGALAADRYSYLACLPWAALAGGGLAWVFPGLERGKRALCLAGAAAVLLLLSLLTLRQIPVWRDSESLWRRATSLDASSAGAHLNLADALEKRGRLEEAERQYREAAALAPKRALAKVDLAQLLERRGAGAEALELCARALESEPGDPRAHLCLGRLLEAAGRRGEAEAHFQKAFARGTRLRMPAPGERPALEAALALRRAELSAAPQSAAARNNLGNALAALGLLQEAARQYRQSLRAEETAAAHYNLGNALALLGRSEEAAAHYGRALAFDPAFEAARLNLRKLQWAAGGEERGGWGSRKR